MYISKGAQCVLEEKKKTYISFPFACKHIPAVGHSIDMKTVFNNVPGKKLVFNSHRNTQTRELITSLHIHEML